MEVKDIKAMGRKLKKFLSKFDDCFGRSEPRANLETIVQGQLSGLERKSLEPIALAAGLSPEVVESSRTRQPPEWESWEQETVYEFAKVLLEDRCVNDSLFEQAVGALGQDGVVDLVGIVGYYSLISMTINVFDVPLPEGAAPERSL